MDEAIKQADKVVMIFFDNSIVLVIVEEQLSVGFTVSVAEAQVVLLQVPSARTK